MLWEEDGRRRDHGVLRHPGIHESAVDSEGDSCPLHFPAVRHRLLRNGEQLLRCRRHAVLRHCRVFHEQSGNFVFTRRAGIDFGADGGKPFPPRAPDVEGELHGLFRNADLLDLHCPHLWFSVLLLLEHAPRAAAEITKTEQIVANMAFTAWSRRQKSYLLSSISA